MLVKHAKNIAAQWVMEEASKVPGFYGAYFAGSTNWMPNDAPVGLQQRFTPSYHRLLDELGVTSYADLQQRTEQIKELLPRIWEVTEAIIATNPEIID